VTALWLPAVYRCGTDVAWIYILVSTGFEGGGGAQGHLERGTGCACRQPAPPAGPARSQAQASLAPCAACLHMGRLGSNIWHLHPAIADALRLCRVLDCRPS
jgi:hypothetical protein